MASCIFIFEVQLIYVGADIEDEKHFNLQPLKPITFLSFFLYKTHVCHISRHERYEICSKLTIKTPEYVKLTINKVNNKDTVDVILVSLLLDLNIIHFLFLLLTLISSLPAGFVACCFDALWLLESI